MLRERMIWSMTENDFDAVSAVHLKGTWNMARHAIKLRRFRPFGIRAITGPEGHLGPWASIE